MLAALQASSQDHLKTCQQPYAEAVLAAFYIRFRVLSAEQRHGSQPLLGSVLQETSPTLSWSTQSMYKYTKTMRVRDGEDGRVYCTLLMAK
jgi:hypothetical protein